MSVGLLDVNMLVAMAWPCHVNHGLARSWFSENQGDGWATCPMTECGFVRISSNPKIIADAVTPQEAKTLLQSITGRAHHVFWPDELPFASSHIPSGHLMGHRQVTDAYLLGLAIQNKGRLVTLDQGVRHLLPHNSPLHRSLCVVRDLD